MYANSCANISFFKIWNNVTLWCQNANNVRRFLIRFSCVCIIFSVVFLDTLWFQTDRLISPVPILDMMGRLPPDINLWVYATALFLCSALFIFPDNRHFGLLMPIIFVFWVLQDQLRWQPFLYMYSFSLLALSLTKDDADQTDFDPLRYMIAGVYFWAGAYKLNTVFVFFIFPWFVEPIFPYKDWASILGLIVPFEEAFIGIALLFPKLRKYGLAMATVMLIVVLLCLGPFGHDWGVVVWPWNVYLYLATFILFFWEKRPLVNFSLIRKKLSLFATVIFIFLPALGGLGYWGAHPSFMLYSGMPPMPEVVFDKREKLDFFSLFLKEKVNNQNGIDMTLLTIDEFYVASTPGWVGVDIFKRQASGLCQRLEYPKSAQLIVRRIDHIWSRALSEEKYMLCENGKDK